MNFEMQMKSITKYDMSIMAQNFAKKIEKLPQRSGVKVSYFTYDNLPNRLLLETEHVKQTIYEGDDYNESLAKAQKISLIIYKLLQDEKERHDRKFSKHR